MLNSHPGKDCGIMKAGMDLQRGPTSCSEQGQLWGQTRLCRVWNPQRMDGACPASLGSLLHCLTILQGIVWETEKGVLLNWYCDTEVAVICFMGEYQSHECRNSQRRSGWFSEQRKGNRAQPETRYFGWEEGRALQIHGWNQLINLNWKETVETLLNFQFVWGNYLA